MGKPSAELPDSLDPAPAASAENVDDLLAQMAGEEIDRLLSESEDPQKADRSRSAAISPELAIDRQVNALFSGSGDARGTSKSPAAALPGAPPPSPAASPAVTSSDDEVSQQLTDLFSDADPPPVSESSAFQPATTADGIISPVAELPAPAAATAIVEHDASSDGSSLAEVSTNSAERAALNAPPIDDDPLKLQLGNEEQEGRSTLSAAYLKPLEWMNSPAGACPDRLRELIGKIALLTLFNATAVLLYIFLFRRHH